MPRAELLLAEPHGTVIVSCCVPTGCAHRNPEIHEDEECLVRVLCNNEDCDVGNWIHGDCFDNWEQTVLTYLRGCGRARSWSEKQRHQNLWTKKGYDLAYRACACNCGKGHLRKDMEAMANLAKEESRKKMRNRRKINCKPLVVMPRGAPTQMANNVMQPSRNINIQTYGGRQRTASLTSTGSSPTGSSSSDGTSPPPSFDDATQSPSAGENTPPSLCSPKVPPGFEAQAGPQQQSPTSVVSRRRRSSSLLRPDLLNTGSIFHQRADMADFESALPRHKRNGVHIKMEDDGLHGTDETRSFVLSTLSVLQTNMVDCCLCGRHMPVFDRYPLVNGTFYLSPVRERGGLEVKGRPQFLNTVCMWCLEGGSDAKCKACGTRWDGVSLLIGSMYAYDIFAAVPCCQQRLRCQGCSRPVQPSAPTGGPLDVDRPFYYSDYSRLATCGYCLESGYHFVKPVNIVYNIRPSVWS